MAFRWVFGRECNRDLLAAMLDAFIPDRKIEEVTLYKESNIPYSKEYKKSVFDVSCRTEDGTYIDVEVQVDPQDWFEDRCLYYSTFNIQGQTEVGKEEYTLRPVYIVSIVKFPRKHGPDWDGRTVSSYSVREDGCGERMTDALHFIYVELNSFRKEWKELENDAERFIYCLKHLHELEELPEVQRYKMIERLAGQAELQQMPAKMKLKYIKDMNTERDRRNQMAYAIRHGHQEGMQQGIQQGMQNMKLTIALNMKNSGMAVSDISRLTGLSEQEIESLS